MKSPAAPAAACPPPYPASCDRRPYRPRRARRIAVFDGFGRPCRRRWSTSVWRSVARSPFRAPHLSRRSWVCCARPMSAPLVARGAARASPGREDARIDLLPGERPDRPSDRSAQRAARDGSPGRHSSAPLRSHKLARADPRPLCGRSQAENIVQAPRRNSTVRRSRISACKSRLGLSEMQRGRRGPTSKGRPHPPPRRDADESEFAVSL